MNERDRARDSACRNSFLKAAVPKAFSLARERLRGACSTANSTIILIMNTAAITRKHSRRAHDFYPTPAWAKIGTSQTCPDFTEPCWSVALGMVRSLLFSRLTATLSMNQIW